MRSKEEKDIEPGKVAKPPGTVDLKIVSKDGVKWRVYKKGYVLKDGEHTTYRVGIGTVVLGGKHVGI